MCSRIIEAELHHRHAGDIEMVPQGVDLRRNESQVFGEERQPPQRFAQFVEDFLLRPIHPSTMDGGGLVRGNLPELLKTAEMIEADVVASVQCPTHALNPPLIAKFSHTIPAVQRVAPALSGSAESVRGN